MDAAGLKADLVARLTFLVGILLRRTLAWGRLATGIRGHLQMAHAVLYSP